MNEQKNNLNEYWTEIITDFVASSLSQKDYATKNNLKVYSVGYWYRKFHTGFTDFIENVETTNNNSNAITSTIEITINKIKIVIKGSYDEELLLKVIRTVKKI